MLLVLRATGSSASGDNETKATANLYDWRVQTAKSHACDGPRETVGLVCVAECSTGYFEIPVSRVSGVLSP